MPSSVGAKLFIVLLSSACAAKTRDRRNIGYAQGYATNAGAIQDYTGQGYSAQGQEAMQVVDQQVQQLAPGENYMSAPADEQQTQPSMDAYQMQAQGYSQPQVQAGQMQQMPQSSFLATAPQQQIKEQPQTEAEAVMSQLAVAVQQQSKAIVELKNEQQILAQLQSDYDTRTLELLERTRATPLCKDYTKPAKVVDDTSCDAACKDASLKDKKYTGGDYEEKAWDGLFGHKSLTSKEYKCTCTGGDKDFLLCDTSTRTTTSLFAALGFALFLIHM